MNWLDKLIATLGKKFVKRMMMILFGLIIGIVIVIASTQFKNETASTTILVFGAVTFGVMIVGVVIDYLMDM